MNNDQKANTKILVRLLFRLLPVQILLSAIGAVNGIVSSFFATNYVGVDAMSAVGVYSPVGMLATSLSLILTGGSAILCGKYMGQNEQEKMQGVFSLNLLLSLFVALLFIATFVPMGLFDLTGFLTKDLNVRLYLNRYFLGQAIGMIPLMLGSSFASFLSIENKSRRTFLASAAYIIVNILLNFLFVKILKMEALGLALASSLGMWVFLAVQAEAFLSGKSHFRIALSRINWKETGKMIMIGLPGAASNVYQTLRGLLVNNMLETFVGSVGISAFSAANNFLSLFWAIPAGMLAVSRMLISVSVGEEDRQTLTDVMRNMMYRFVPIQCVISLLIILCAVPFTQIFYKDPSQAVFAMTVMGFRILPICMPLSIICMHFTCYGQISNKQVLIHTLALLDGVVCVAGFTALLIRGMGIKSVYIANVLNGVVTTIAIYLYSWVMNKRFPRNMEELMVIPKDFGVSPEERMDLSVRTMEEVISVSRQVQEFCTARGISKRSAYLAGLSMEEMAGNIVDHGFRKDNRSHSIDVRVAHKKDDVILRIKDDCVPFDPGERQKLSEDSDAAKNIGLRMIFRMAKDIKYQNILGLNVLTIRIPAVS
ncbi:MAG: MATE family efflux transporter [Erysipelotrichaceae bacterium]|nr:MATE family efflux transporter [Erysipelotrichaceae bacterium]